MADCKAKNPDVGDPGAYCAQIHHDITGEWPSEGFAVTIPTSAAERDASMHPDFLHIRSLFCKRYGEAEGCEKYIWFVTANGLNQQRPYNPSAQFKESFQWVEPLINTYRQDTEAKYYKVVCLTANISMNNNDYRDYEKMKHAAPSMAWRPININHTDRWLPFPRTRVDFVSADDLAVEAILRVDNQDRWLQDALDAGDIVQPSIEGRPLPGGMDEGYHFTGLALLERGAQLPGDPLTSIQPVFLNESIGRAICRIVDGQVVCGEQVKEQRKMSEQEDNRTSFIATCIEQGKSQEECESEWNAKQEQVEPEQDVATQLAQIDLQIQNLEQQLAAKQGPLKPAEEDAETIMIRAEMEVLYAKRRGIQDAIARAAAPTAAVAPAAEQVDVPHAQPAEVPADPPPETEYPLDSLENFMPACLAANADDSQYCLNLWKELTGQEAPIDWRTDQASVGEKIIRLEREKAALRTRLTEVTAISNSFADTAQDEMKRRKTSDAKLTTANAQHLKELKKIQSLHEAKLRLLQVKHDAERKTLQDRNARLRTESTRTASTDASQIATLKDQLQESKAETNESKMKNLDLQKKSLSEMRRLDEALEKAKQDRQATLDARRESATVSERFAGLQQEIMDLSTEKVGLNKKLVKSESDKRRLIENLEEANAAERKSKILAKQILKKLAERKLIYTDDAGKIVTADDLD